MALKLLAEESVDDLPTGLRLFSCAGRESLLITDLFIAACQPSLALQNSFFVFI